MADEYRKLSRDELDKLAGEPLPERAAMSLINANVLSDHSIAYANAEQDVQITQSN